MSGSALDTRAHIFNLKKMVVEVNKIMKLSFFPTTVRYRGYSKMPHYSKGINDLKSDGYVYHSKEKIQSVMLMHGHKSQGGVPLKI